MNYYITIDIAKELCMVENNETEKTLEDILLNMNKYTFLLNETRNINLKKLQ